MDFDPRKAKALAPGEHLTFPDCPGLRLEARKARRTWIYRYKVGDRMRQTRIGTWPAMSAIKAASEWDRLRGSRDDAGEIQAADKRRATRTGAALTIRDVCDQYLEEHVAVRRNAKSQDLARWLFDHLLGEAGGWRAAALTRTQAFELISRHAATPVNAAKLRAELGAAYDHALDAGRLPDTTANWWRLILRGKLKSKGRKRQGKNVVGKRVLSEREVGALIAWLPNMSEMMRDCLTLYLWTGARGGEIVQMERGELDDQGDVVWWTLPLAKTKNAHRPGATDHRVPLVGRAAEIARRRAASGTSYLFPSRGASGHVEQKTVSAKTHYHQPYCRTEPKRARPRLPVTHWSPHDLRRTVRTMLASMGCPRDAGEVIIGHMLEGVEGTYNLHAYDAERLHWIKRLDERLEAAVRSQVASAPIPQPRKPSKLRAAR